MTDTAVQEAQAQAAGISGKAYIAAEILAAHKELDDLDVPRKNIDGERLSISQRIGVLRRRLDRLRVYEVPAPHNKLIPGGPLAWDAQASRC